MPAGKGTYGKKMGRPSLASQGAAERRKRDSKSKASKLGSSVGKNLRAAAKKAIAGAGGGMPLAAYKMAKGESHSKSKAPKATSRSPHRTGPATAKPKPMTAAQVAKASVSNPDAKYILTSGAPTYRGTNTPQKRSAAAVRKQTQARVSRRKK